MTQETRSVAGLPWIAAIAFFMQALDATILNTAVPAIAKSLNHSPLAMQSAIISYTLTVAMLIPISGWLADKFGTRKIFTLSVLLFVSGSLLCAMSGSLLMLVAARIIQGVGGAMMMPVARLALLRAYPRSELLQVLNFITIPGLVGPIIGPLLGGWLVTYATWHWIFLINIPIGLIGIFYARIYMPDFTAPSKKFDTLGFLLFGLSLVMMLSALSLFSEKIVSTTISVTIFIIGIALLLMYIRHALTSSHPLFHLSLFKIRTFSIGIFGGIISRLGTGSVPFLMPLMLQVGFGYSALTSGMMMAPTAVGSLMAKSAVTAVLRRFGYKKTLICVTVLIGIMIAMLSLQNAGEPLWMLIVPMFIIGIVMSIQFTSMNTITLGDLDEKTASSGNSLMAVSQQLSVSFGVAVSATVLHAYESVSFGNTIDHFHYTFITMGLITLMSSTIFMNLSPNDGSGLINKKK